MFLAVLTAETKGFVDLAAETIALDGGFFDFFANNNAKAR